MNVLVSYLKMSGPELWGTIGSVVTHPGNGRYVILRKLDPERGPDGYILVDLMRVEIMGTFDREKHAREYVGQVCAERAEVERSPHIAAGHYIEAEEDA